ncbi:EamA family transporter [Psychromarinibacter sp. C21-152]|uniref:EamA family transporter n=1 Tax=Psychromarinibacter sediminicola TaxID=3033385 RepID=A0AAE3NNA7_9RHOB|nr:EamA family transporter [Psychromarinibacter sediminicola]MDF0601128.1 EamA family transporter [Psychromarinibacter sediminicola]
MTAGVFAIVLLAALLHAGWNAMVKGGADKAAAMTAVILGQGLCGLALVPFAPLPAPAVWPWLAGGVALHLGYNVFLILAYRIGDLTQVYPIARGASPLLVVLGTALFFGTTFTPFELTAIVTISIGIASTSLVRRADGLFQGKAALLALITGGFIAGYSIVDGHGARQTGDALAYFGWLSLIDGVVFLAGWAVVRPGVLRQAVRLRRHLFLGGGASFTAYLLVVWAFTQAPIAHVTALRETSIVFALLIGVTILNERLSLAKVASTAMTIAGAILLRMNRN